MYRPIDFKGGQQSAEPSCVSMKSDGSMYRPIDFKGGQQSAEPSCVSMKSDGSMYRPIDFKGGQQSPEPSCVSMKSDGSMYRPFNFKGGQQSAEPSCVSMTRDWSMGFPVKEKRVLQDNSEVPRVQSTKQRHTDLDSIFMLLEENIVHFVKNELRKFQRVLSPDYPEFFHNQRNDDKVVNDEDEEQRRSSREAFLKITMNFLRRMKQEELADCLQSSKRI
ncbi:uncharacterized protein LOC111645230 [Seriola lalandi dorsalis]|uniref:uncharacterized protein LOC111645230 n=1 Tax=Seriola lalandi dorsalis TaxID=1841481 RepID=UPI000C6FA8EA|nr:uncharacterized protein LOC111645230 [Seriola lalandi dorsalis]